METDKSKHENILGSDMSELSKSVNILVIGGDSSNSCVVKYVTSSKQWKKMPDSSKRCNASAVVAHQKVYLMGGTKELKPLKSIETLSINDEKPIWDKKAGQLLEHRQAFGAAVSEDEDKDSTIVCAGGARRLVAGSSTECYSNLFGRFLHEKMNEARCYHGVACVGMLVFVIGGKNEWNKILNSVESKTLGLSRWKKVTSMNTCRWGLVTVALNDEIYAIGGHDGHCALSSVEKYNLNSETWCSVASMNEQRCGLGACIVNGLIYVFGGDGAKTVEVYNPVKDTWIIESEMDTPRTFPCVVALSGEKMSTLPGDS